MTSTDQEFFVPDAIYGIIGHPLGHTLSPLLHNWGFRKYGLQAAYFRWPLLPENLPEFLAAVRTLPIFGVSVTIPHKRAVMPYLDDYSQDARHVGAVNTLYWKEGRLWGENTDVLGFLKPLETHLALIQSALILGVGGAARAALQGLKQAGVQQIAITGRKPEAAEQLAQEFGVNRLDWTGRADWRGDLLVNATPLGMMGQLVEQSPWPGEMTDIRHVYDLVYNPRKTAFLRQGETSGAHTIEGMDMFTAQAIAQFQLWTGLTPDSVDFRNIVMSALHT
ncbi:shikimate dehydrogenase [Desulfonatronum thiosulfatophilum]|uniref:Shikimate dehydrogenase (NADP(+)) n=1 Tax=Desulfonatronum thiosulfatophilum TaxID=617002 RepID=A0A1G6B809_9BACT|nr:shikimate dehydrogenase [Desulfonatronum thiosulfatophilum]SDB16785.1 shikimate dehydrogenase [Desulfonatronum thiosulfatophilum]